VISKTPALFIALARLAPLMSHPEILVLLISASGKTWLRGAKISLFPETPILVVELYVIDP